MIYRLLALAWVFAGNTLLAQFESLAEKETAKDKLDNFFIQADNLSELFAVAFLRSTVTINQSNGSVTEATGSGLSVKSDEHRLKYFCLEYDAVFKPPTRWRMESFVVGKIERRRQTDGNKLREPAKVELDPETGFRTELQKNDAFSSLGAEINPYGFILASRFPARGRNSAVEKVISTWITRLELKSESESKGRILSKWNSFGKEEQDVGRREIEFDSSVGFLPTACRLFLIDQSGKKQVTGVKTSWEKDKSERWRPIGCVVTDVLGPYTIEDSFLFSWVEPEQLKSLLSKGKWNEFISDNNSDWYRNFAEFVGESQKDRLQGNGKKVPPQ